MGKKTKEIVIPKERAVFWLDKNGYWHNAHGKFQHKKIIAYFHESIKKDKNGYYLEQIKDDCREKVYFLHEDTALFVFDVICTDTILLVLNTKKKIQLKPRQLFIENDSLYMGIGDDTVKFSVHAMMKMAAMLEFDNAEYFIRIGDRRYSIKERGPSFSG